MQIKKPEGWRTGGKAACTRSFSFSSAFLKTFLFTVRETLSDFFKLVSLYFFHIRLILPKRHAPRCALLQFFSQSHVSKLCATSAFSFTCIFLFILKSTHKTSRFLVPAMQNYRQPRQELPAIALRRNWNLFYSASAMVKLSITRPI